MKLLEDRHVARDIQGREKAKWAVENNNPIKKFTEADIARITSKYSTPIGKGGFGEVFRGVMGDNHDLVAVKRYIRADLREEFMEEVSIHSQINHKNVVRLIGYCSGKDILTMVTEYVPKGNLDDTLHRSDINISLDTRLRIAIGCAEALSYMHSMHLSSVSLVYHGDIKPANILLDDNLTAKVSDFGLSRLLSGGITRYTSNVKGSIDYMDPIYLREGRLTPRSDVYGFGAVLLELITRRRVKEGNISLIGILCQACAGGKGLRELFDVKLVNENNVKILEGIARLAAECLSLYIDKRPTMDDVAKRLVMFRKGLQRGQGIGWHYKSFGIFKRIARNDILTELANVRILTKEELNQITQNYAYALGGSGKGLKGTLEDNTVVVVKKFNGSRENWKTELINLVMILSHICHKNIIKLLGCCLETDTPMLVYEHASNGSLYDILDGQEDFPLDQRMKIAIKTAEALEYLHSSATGIIAHGSIEPYNILLDDNFMPKLNGLSGASRLIKDGEIAADYSVISSGFLRNLRSNNPITYQQELPTVKRDIYMFGILLLALIGRKNYKYSVDHDRLVIQFNATWNDRRGRRFLLIPTGKLFFDKDITDKEDINLLEEISKLALKCTVLYEKTRPTMKKLVESLRKLTWLWKIYTNKGATNS